MLISLEKKLQRLQRGYSLVEMAIVISVVGLLTAGFFGVYNVYLKTQRVQLTQNNSSVVTSALTNYLIQNGHYPCPARLDASRTDSDYGVATECDSTKVGYPTALTPGTCANGLCEEEGTTASADYQNVAYTCRTINSGLPLVLTPPGGKQFVDVAFASYGLPTGSFSGTPDNCVPNFSVTPSCNAISSVEKIRTVFKDKTSATTMLVNDAAFGGDPCPTVTPTGAANRWLYVVLKTANTVASAATTKVRRGMVPFRSLGIPESVAEDGYGMRFNYAVTEPLATDSYQQNGGAITIVDSVHTTAQYVHYVVYSSGEDRRGAYTNQGVASMPCVAGRLDTENCNTTTDASAIYRYTELSTATGPTHFDDYLKYYTSTETPLWRVSSNTANVDIQQMNNGKVGIGMDPNTTSAILQVNGAVRTNDRAYAQTLCEEDGTNCQIGGGDFGKPLGDPKFQCPRPSDPAGYDYIQTLQNGQVTCTNAKPVTCPNPNQYISGVDSTGAIICRAIVGCPSENVSVCSSDDFTLAAGAQGTVRSNSPPLGTSRVAEYTCNSSGNWENTNNTGYCNCNAGTEQQTRSCNSVQPRVGTWGDLNNGRGNWTGQWKRDHTHYCTPTEGDSYTSWDKDDCECKDYLNYSDSQGCGTGYTGTQTRTEDWVCDNDDSGHYTPWTAWAGTCTCDASTPDDVDVHSCAWAGHGAGYNTGNVTVTKHWTCSGATGSWDAGTTADTCTCSAVKDTPYTTGCTAPEVGTLTYQRTFNCTTNDWDAPQLIANNCGIPVYYWRATTGASAPSDNPTGYASGSTCTPNGAISPCYAAAGGGKYYNYATCQCQ